MRQMKDAYLAAMRADAIPEGWARLWHVHKLHLPKGNLTIHEGEWVDTPPGVYTYLRCLTDSTLHLVPAGELVMEDTPHELRTHLGFVMKAHGSVLVTGLGLGCVVRGLLANPRIEHVTCIENSPDVLKLVAPYMPTERLTIIEADAFQWVAHNKQPFDCAWHDLWVNPDKDETHLDIWHAQLLANCKQFVKRQGAWALNRAAKTMLIRRGFSWIG